MKDKDVIGEIQEMRNLSVPELVVRYEEEFGKPPRCKRKEFLWKRVCWKIQERLHGGLCKSAKAKLESLISEINIPEFENRLEGIEGQVPETRIKKHFFYLHGFSSCELEKNQGDKHKAGYQKDDAVSENVAKKTRHRCARLLRDGSDHEVGCISDIAAGTEKDRSSGNRLQVHRLFGHQQRHRLGFRHTGKKTAESRIEEGQIGRRIVQK